MMMVLFHVCSMIFDRSDPTGAVSIFGHHRRLMPMTQGTIYIDDAATRGIPVAARGGNPHLPVLPDRLQGSASSSLSA
jgi:hypothetical protein